MAPKNDKSSILAVFLLWMATWCWSVHLVSARQNELDIPTAFNIQLHYLNDVDVEIQQIFESTKKRWERVLVHSDIDTRYVVRKWQLLCGFLAPEREEIDDLLIYVKIAAIDGPGSILGQAGPCAVDREQRVRVGFVELDLDDVLSLIQTDRANVTILHEIGHILGIGTLWDSYRLIGESDDHELEDYKIRYLGKQGNIGNEEVGMKYEAVVEDSGAEGTIRSHWEEEIYEDELMTGYAPSSGVILLSKLTVRSLADLGYSVDIEQADEFQVDPDIVDDLEWEDTKAAKLPKSGKHLRGSQKPKQEDKNHRNNKQSYGQDVLHLPIIILESEPPKLP